MTEWPNQLNSFGMAVSSTDTEWLTELYDLHATRVFSLAVRITRNVVTAEDVVQDVFLQAWHQRHRYDPARGSVCGWLLMITRSRSVDRLRASRGLNSVTWNECAFLRAPEVVDADDMRRIREALAILPAEQRRALELAFFEGYSHPEISKLLNEPLGTVKTRIRSAMIRLRAALR